MSLDNLKPKAPKVTAIGTLRDKWPQIEAAKARNITDSEIYAALIEEGAINMREEAFRVTMARIRKAIKEGTNKG